MWYLQFHVLCDKILLSLWFISQCPPFVLCATGRSHLHYIRMELFFQYHIGISLFLNPRTIRGFSLYNKQPLNFRGCLTLKPNCFTAFYILQTVHFCFSNLPAYLISSGEWEKCSVAIKLWYCGHSEYFMDSGFIFIAGETIKLIDCPISSWIHLDWLFTFFVESKKFIKDKNKRQSGQNFASIYFFTKQCWKTKKML